MAAPQGTQADPATALQADHQRLTSIVSRLMDFVEASDDSLIREEWDQLESALLRHLDAEEMLLLPMFESEHAADVAAIRAEQTRLRTLLGEGGIALELHTLRVEDVGVLRSMLSAHAAHMDQTVASLREPARSEVDRARGILLTRWFRPGAPHQDVVSTALCALVAACEDGELGYARAAADVHDEGYRLIFSRNASERAAFAKELRQALSELGARLPPEGSVLGSLHRRWLDVKSELTRGRPRAILRECERGEEAALSTYRSALHVDLPPATREVVQEQYEVVKKAHEEVCSLLRMEQLP